MSTTSSTAASPRRWKIALVAALIAGPLFGAAVGTAWAAQTFPDVPPNHTFYEEVEWGAQHRIINGFPDGTFRPGQTITRGEAAAFLSHYNDQIKYIRGAINPQPAKEFTLTASCLPNERAISVSGRIDIDNVFMTDAYVTGSNGVVKWETENDVTRDPGLVEVTTMCVPGRAG